MEFKTSPLLQNLGKTSVPKLTQSIKKKKKTETGEIGDWKNCSERFHIKRRAKTILVQWVFQAILLYFKA